MNKADDGAGFGSLRDFDWSMRMMLASDKLSGLNKPILHLKLDIATDNVGTNLQENVIELDNEELKHLIKVLKEAQAVAKLK